MKQTVRVMTFLAAVVLPAFGDFDAGKRAWDKKNYAAAFREWKPLAEAGDARAQFYLGVLYNHGRGVKKNFEEAVKWYRLAAMQGHAKAQCNLGTMHGSGLGVVKDPVQAQMWFHLAAESKDEEAIKNCSDNLAKNAPNLTLEQQAQAREMARKWKPAKTVR